MDGSKSARAWTAKMPWPAAGLAPALPGSRETAFPAGCACGGWPSRREGKGPPLPSLEPAQERLEGPLEEKKRSTAAEG